LKDKTDIKIFKELSLEKQIEIIVKQYSKDLYWVIRPIVKTHEDTDDVLQNTLIKIYQNLPKFRFDSKLFSWMYRIAVNESLNHLRKNKNLFSTIDETLIENLKADRYYNGDEILVKLEKAILKLPKRQQEIFRLKYFSELKYDEIAELLQVSVGSLKASYHLAVKKIKNELNLLN